MLLQRQEKSSHSRNGEEWWKRLNGGGDRGTWRRKNQGSDGDMVEAETR